MEKKLILIFTGYGCLFINRIASGKIDECGPIPNRFKTVGPKFYQDGIDNDYFEFSTNSIVISNE